MIKNLLLICCAVLLVGSTRAQDTIRYSVVVAGQIKGFHKTWKNVDGSFTTWYQYNDRGRGDSILSTFRLNEKGLPVSIVSTGVDYMKNPIKEEFTWANGTARWKNSAENVERPNVANAYFIGLNNSVGNIYTALKQNGNSIPLLPFGEAKLEVLQSHTISKNDISKKVSLASLSGFGFTPSYSWIDEDYEEFGSVSEWFSTIREGYEDKIGELLALQKKVEDAYLNSIAKKNSTSAGVLLIQHINLFDARNAVLVKDVDVLVMEGKIAQVSKGKRISSEVERIIDGTGKTLLPGLWDMHVHIGDLEGILHLAGGVTHVRDMGNDSSLLDRIEKIKKGTIIGPNIEIMSGFIDGAGPLAAPTGALINNVDEGIKAIHDYASKGYQQIKLYSSIKPEWVKPLAAEAHKYKMRVAGHIPAFMTAEQAIAVGYDEITHLNMLALNFFGDTVDTRSPNRFRLPAAKTAGLDLQGAAMKKFIALLKEKKIAVDPTIGVFESLFTARDGKMEERYKTIVDRMPSTYQRTIRAGGGGVPVPEGMNETYLKSFDAFLKITKLLYDNGIRIVAGTDGLAGFDLHRELELYVKAGIPAGKVLQIATYGTAQYLGKEKQYGIVEAGRSADFIIVDGNPVNNISDIRNTRFIVKNGIIYDAGKLYESISIKAR